MRIDDRRACFDSRSGFGCRYRGDSIGEGRGCFAYGTSRTADKLERAKVFGLTSSIVVDNDPLKFAEAANEWTDGAGVNVVLDLVGAAYLKANLQSLAIKGRLIFVGTTSGSKAEIDYAIVMGKRLRIMGTSLRTRPAEEKATATRLFAQQVLPLLATGAVTAGHR